MLTGTRDDNDVMSAGSLHARACACWIPTCPPDPCTCQCLCPLDPRTPMSVPDRSTHVRTRAPHVFTRRVPTRACSQGPHAGSLAGSPHVLTRRVPMQARSQGPHTCSLAGSPYMHTPGPCTCTRTGSPHALTRRVPMHVYMCPLDASCVHPSAVCIGRVICSSSSSTVL